MDNSNKTGLERAQVFYDMKQSGIPAHEIGALFGISRNAVYGALHRYRKDLSNKTREKLFGGF